VPVEDQPIFRLDVVRLPLLGFSLPEQVAQRREKLKKWAEIISTGSVDAHKEQEILGGFINDVFCELLCYTRAVGKTTQRRIAPTMDRLTNITSLVNERTNQSKKVALGAWGTYEYDERLVHSQKLGSLPIAKRTARGVMTTMVRQANLCPSSRSNEKR
jgi:hypothetical protein